MFFCLISSNSVNAIEYGGFGGKPAYVREDNPRTESIFIHTLNAGDKAEDGVLVINNTAEEKNIIIYATDSEVSTGGAFACAQLVQEKKEVGSWIELSKTEVTLASGETEIVPFTINVPDNASVGEHNGCILIQEKDDDTPSNLSKGIQLSMRLGLRVAINIPGEIIKELELKDFILEQDKEKDLIRFKPIVKNNGNVSIDANVKVVTKYLWGNIFSKIGGEFPVLRGQESEWNFEMAKPYWGGWYYSQAEIEYESDPSKEIGTVNDENKTLIKSNVIWFFSTPETKALIVEIVVLLLIITLVVLIIIRIMQRKWIKKSWIFYEVKSSQNIKSIADIHKVSWKLLVKVNKLKAPYYVQKGEKLRVPSNEE